MVNNNKHYLRAGDLLQGGDEAYVLVLLLLLNIEA